VTRGAVVVVVVPSDGSTGSQQDLQSSVLDDKHWTSSSSQSCFLWSALHSASSSSRSMSS
jgi:hypothetical protein